jgi:hypothetical protein
MGIRKYVPHSAMLPYRIHSRPETRVDIEVERYIAIDK